VKGEYETPSELELLHITCGWTARQYFVVIVIVVYLCFLFTAGTVIMGEVDIEKISYEERVKNSTIISKPMASKQLAKRLAKLIKKGKVK